MKFGVTFSFLKIDKKALGLFDFIEMEGISLFRHVPKKQLSVLRAIEKMSKCWPALNHIFKVWVKKKVLH